jgi:DNA-binding NarL/FixJ family response regulator
MIRLLVVDDHTSFRESLVFMLDLVDDITVVGQAGDVGSAKTAIESTAIDVALLDLDLAGDRGIDLIGFLRMHHPHAEAIVLTGNPAEKSRAQAIAAGAAGVLHKSTSIQIIVDGIRRVADGQSLISAKEATELMRQGNVYLSTEKEGHKALAQLSQREQDVLRALAAGLDNHAIAERLFVSHDTVRSHIVRIYRKLGVDSRLQAVLFAVRHRFLTEDDLA